MILKTYIGSAEEDSSLDFKLHLNTAQSGDFNRGQLVEFFFVLLSCLQRLFELSFFACHAVYAGSPHYRTAIFRTARPRSWSSLLKYSHARGSSAPASFSTGTLDVSLIACRSKAVLEAGGSINTKAPLLCETLKC